MLCDEGGSHVERHRAAAIGHDGGGGAAAAAELETDDLAGVGPERHALFEQLGVELNPRGNVAKDADWMTNVPGVFVAGDMGRGQSLIVWAIAEGRSAAASTDRYLMGETALPAPLSAV